MEAKEKAKQLVQRYVDIMPMLYNQTGDQILKHAKQCALIAVDEIIKATNNMWDSIDHLAINDYWQEVKQEINSL
jgi:HD superfamily phosphodiesterase